MYHKGVAPFVHPEAAKERAMKRDLIGLTGVSVAMAVTGWFFWGNPEKTPHQTLHHNPDLTLVSERSPYMRDER